MRWRWLFGFLSEGHVYLIYGNAVYSINVSVKQCLIIFEGEKVPPIVISYWNVSRLTLLYLQSEAAAGRGGVVSPAYSVDSTVTVSTVSSSTATEKSVRFSDRDHILSTPGECWLSRITLLDLAQCHPLFRAELLAAAPLGLAARVPALGAGQVHPQAGAEPRPLQAEPSLQPRPLQGVPGLHT